MESLRPAQDVRSLRSPNTPLLPPPARRRLERLGPQLLAPEPRDLPRSRFVADALEQVAREHKVKVYKTVMSLSGGINLGPETVALALASDKA